MKFDLEVGQRSNTSNMKSPGCYDIIYIKILAFNAIFNAVKGDNFYTGKPKRQIIT